MPQSLMYANTAPLQMPFRQLANLRVVVACQLSNQRRAHFELDLGEIPVKTQWHVVCEFISSEPLVVEMLHALVDRRHVESEMYLVRLSLK